MKISNSYSSQLLADFCLRHSIIKSGIQVSPVMTDWVHL